MSSKIINVAKEFSRYPAGRYAKDGPYSGERFREYFLIPALKANEERITVVFDGARGLASSFLEESFGGLVRRGFNRENLIARFRFESADQSIIDEVISYIRS